MRLAPVAVLLCALNGAVAQDTARTGTVPSARAPLGALVGTVIDQDRRPLADVDIVAPGIARRTRSRADGSFTLAGLPPGDHEVRFRKLGYDPAELTLNVVPGQQLSVAVTLGLLSQKLNPVLIQATVFNEIGGLVVDEHGQPVEGAEVAVDGAGRSVRTRADGGFLFLDVAPGRYLLRVRKLGYRPQQRALEMVKQLERTLTIRLSGLAQELSAVEIVAQSGMGARDSVARREFNARRAMAGTQSDLITRDELARSGRAPLSAAIRERALGLMKGGSACVLIDGDQPLIDPAESSGSWWQGPSRAGRPTSIGGGSSGRMSGGSRASPGAQFTVLQTLFADQVEAVEIYNANSENSRTACARFPANSRCTCGAQTPSVVVVWLKH